MNVINVPTTAVNDTLGIHAIIIREKTPYVLHFFLQEQQTAPCNSVSPRKPKSAQVAQVFFK